MRKFYCSLLSRIRTYDLQIRSLLLYPAELWRVVVPEARLELAILAEVDFKSTVYAIPPLGDNNIIL